MRTFRFAIALISMFVLFSGFTLPEKPQARINDYANALSAGERSELEQRFARFENQTGHQAVVAIFSDIEDEPVEDVAVKLFEKWRLGSKEKNDGILLVLAMAQRAVRIEVGYGLEGDLPDTLSGQIIADDLVPQLRNKNVAGAIAAFEKRIEDLFVRGEKPAPKRHKNGSRLLFWIIIAIIALLLIGGRAGPSNTIGSGGIRRRRSGIFPIFWGGGGWGNGGGWGGGGSWGGGGGGLSGGGGASGRW